MFQQFKKLYHSVNRSSKKYYVRLRDKGDVYFSVKFLLDNNLEDYRYVDIYVDLDNQELGFHFVEEKGENSFVLSRRKKKLPFITRINSILHRYPDCYYLLVGEHEPQINREKTNFFILSQKTKIFE